jgi:two-component sensor histidine kinase
MSLDEFKIIFYWEYAHRLLARFVGLFTLAPLLFFSLYFKKTEYFMPHGMTFEDYYEHLKPYRDALNKRNAEERKNKERAEKERLAEEQKARELLILNNEITQADHKLKASLEEKEVLLKEIHHRVKNNMQVITSLMALQARQVTDERLLYEFQSTQHRIQSMAMIHEMLYDTMDLVHINYEHYLNSLVPKLITSMKGIDSNIATDISATDIQLGIDTAIPLGLLINELVTNSLKYAFPNGDGGCISLEIKLGPGQYEMNIGDDGVGFAEDFDFKNSKSLGIRLAHNLIEQLEGSITRKNSKGTHYAITFKEIHSSS